MITGHNEELAIRKCLESIRKHYPDSVVNVFLDGGSAKSARRLGNTNTSIMVVPDTLSATFAVTTENFRDANHQSVIMSSVSATLERLEYCLGHTSSRLLLMLDPDTKIRGHLAMPRGAALAGSLVNNHLPIEYSDYIRAYTSGFTFTRWGATPGLMSTSAARKAVAAVKANPNYLEDLSRIFYAVYAHDLLLPTIFALIHEPEVHNPQLTECRRSRMWRFNRRPLVHQYRRYYPPRITQ